MSRLLHSIGYCLLLLVLYATVAPAPSRPVTAVKDSQLSSLPPVVRLRKLHLVRPDLIPYPIAYAVYC